MKTFTQQLITKARRSLSSKRVGVADAARRWLDAMDRLAEAEQRNRNIPHIAEVSAEQWAREAYQLAAESK